MVPKHITRRLSSQMRGQLFHFDCVIFDAIYLMPSKIMSLMLEIELIRCVQRQFRPKEYYWERQSHFCKRRKVKFSLAIFKRNKTHIISFYVCGDNGFLQNILYTLTRLTWSVLWMMVALQQQGKRTHWMKYVGKILRCVRASRRVSECACLMRAHC